MKASPRELLVLAVALAVLGAVLYGPHVLHGGFAIDDWTLAAEAKFSPHIVSDYWTGSEHVSRGLYLEATTNRPVVVLYLPLLYSLLGETPGLYHLWSALLAGFLSLALFAVLRRFDIVAPHAAAISILAFLFPWYDATRFWAASNHITLAVVLALGGLLLALHGLAVSDARELRRGRLWHAGAVALYALSVLSYEVTGVVLLLVGGLYLTRTYAVKSALLRWGADVVVVAGCLSWNGTHSGRERLPLSGALSHAGEIIDGGSSVLAHAALPLDLGRGVAIAALLTIAAASLLALHRLPPGSETRCALRRWLTIGGVGLIVVVAGWALIVPAGVYYNPAEPGLGNRVNAMAGLGVVLTVYAAVALLTTLVVAAARSPLGIRRARSVTTGLSLVLAGSIAIGYANHLNSDRRTWDRAARKSAWVLDSIEAAIGEPPSGAAIYAFGAPTFEQPGIPIFVAFADLGNAVRLRFDDRSLSAYPIAAMANRVACGPHRTVPSGFGVDVLHPPGALYGHSVFVDIQNRTAAYIHSRAQCRAYLHRLRLAR